MADARGAWGSEGDVTMCAPEEAEACYDLIEWAGEQDWSNGKVGMAGVSWYAVIQWAVAASPPAAPGRHQPVGRLVRPLLGSRRPTAASRKPQFVPSSAR